MQLNLLFKIILEKYFCSSTFENVDYLLKILMKENEYGLNDLFFNKIFSTINNKHIALDIIFFCKDNNYGLDFEVVFQKMADTGWNDLLDYI